MLILEYILIFIVGSAIGSFLNVVVDRSNAGKSFLKGRSHCDHCKHVLHWTDLIPIFSFLFLKGKCRYCGHKLSLYYPIVEIVTGLAFVVLFVSIGITMLSSRDIRYLLAAGYYLFIISTLVVIFFADLKYGIIPFSAVFPAVFLTVLWYILLPVFNFTSSDFPMLISSQHYFINYFLSALGASLFFFLLFAFTKGRGMGFGDVVYAFLMGFLLGFPNIILSLYIAFLSGAFIAILLVLFHKKKLKGSTIPFGPFLVLGTVIALFWGKTIVENIMLFLVR